MIHSCSNVNQRGTIIFTCNFQDEENTDVIPKSIIWSLYDSQKNVINDRENISIVNLASTIDIVLHGDDTDLLDSDYPLRILKVSAIYDSELEDSLELEEELTFKIIKSFK
jgi:hypothetical protein